MDIVFISLYVTYTVALIDLRLFDRYFQDQEQPCNILPKDCVFKYIKRVKIC